MFIVKYLSDNIKTYFRYHVAVKELSKLSDRELKDLGINRYEIPYIVYGSIVR